MLWFSVQVRAVPIMKTPVFTGVLCFIAVMIASAVVARLAVMYQAHYAPQHTDLVLPSVT